MAKKKKQPKQNIKKRQTQKAQKRKQVKAKLASKQPAQKKMSMSKVKKNLKLLPALIFEPELSVLAFSPAQLKAGESAGEKTPDRIDQVADAAFLEVFVTALKAMDHRFHLERDANKNMMTQAMLYFMAQDKSPACLNQLIVSLYFNGLHKAQTGQDLEFAELNQILKNYDQEYESYLEEKSKDLSVLGQEAADEAGEEEDDSSFTPEGAFGELLADLDEWAAESELSSEQQEQLLVDLTLLLDDYASEKGWSELAELTPARVKNFRDGWFVRQMSPTDQDKTLMDHSLSTFFGSPLAMERLGSKNCVDILSQLG